MLSFETRLDRALSVRTITETPVPDEQDNEERYDDGARKKYLRLFLEIRQPMEEIEEIIQMVERGEGEKNITDVRSFWNRFQETFYRSTGYGIRGW